MSSFLNFHEIDDEGIVDLYPSAIGDTLELFQCIIKNSKFKQNQIVMWGKVLNVPRLEAWHGDFDYSYSGIKLKAEPWYPALKRVKQQVEFLSDEVFNSCLINLYRDGDHYINYHSDDENELGPNPTIASVSLGASRKFLVRKKTDHSKKKTFILGDGDILIMKGRFQEEWEHGLPKMSKVVEPRINITFRKIFSKGNL
jgi:alkylated DNA repair dioxygenase AlkB